MFPAGISACNWHLSGLEACRLSVFSYSMCVRRIFRAAWEAYIWVRLALTFGIVRSSTPTTPCPAFGFAAYALIPNRFLMHCMRCIHALLSSPTSEVLLLHPVALWPPSGPSVGSRLCHSPTCTPDRWEWVYTLCQRRRNRATRTMSM